MKRANGWIVRLAGMMLVAGTSYADSVTLANGKIVTGRVCDVLMGQVNIELGTGEVVIIPYQDVRQMELDGNTVRSMFTVENVEAAGRLRRLLGKAAVQSAAPAVQEPRPGLMAELVREINRPGAAFVGTWRYESASLSHYEEILLTLRADGTYTKRLRWRSSMVVGGATGTGPTGGGTHSGTWTANGSTVHLSGDGNWPAYSHDLAAFHRMQ